jgi:hypothetical protein
MSAKLIEHRFNSCRGLQTNIMATKKANTYINTELEWAEEQLMTWKAYVDANPLHTLQDRINWKPTAKGGTMPMVIASIEQQGKFIQETMKNYLTLLEVVNNLREKEEKKIELRGDSQVNGMMSDMMKNKS